MPISVYPKILIVLSLFIGSSFLFPSHAKADKPLINPSLDTYSADPNHDLDTVVADEPTNYIFKFTIRGPLGDGNDDRIDLFFTNDEKHYSEDGFNNCIIRASTDNGTPLFFNGAQCSQYFKHNTSTNDDNQTGDEGGGDRDFFKFAFPDDDSEIIPAGSTITITIEGVVLGSKNFNSTGTGGYDDEPFFIDLNNYESFRDDMKLIGGTECDVGGFGCWIKWLATTLIEFFIDVLATILGYFIYILLFVASYLLQGAKFVNTQFVENMLGTNGGDPKAEAAHIGFNIMLGLTNIGFVIAIIVIAFATMLRRENFGIKMLPRLIIIAIIINFSSLIAVSIIGVSNQVANALTHVIAQQNPNTDSECDPDNWGCTFNTFFKRDSTSKATADKSAKGEWSAVAERLISVLMAFLMGMMAFFVLIATAIMLIIRYIFLTFLIILLPLALLSKIFPNLKTPDGGNHWNKWQASFTKWVLFYPVVMLFISIAVYMANWFTAHPLEQASGGLSGAAYGIFASMIEAIVVCGIMLGGMLVADRFGLAGADYAANMGSWASRRVTGFAGGAALRGVGALGRGTRTFGGAIRQGAEDRKVARVQLGPDVKYGPSFPMGKQLPMATEKKYGPSFPMGKKLPMASDVPGTGTFADIAQQQAISAEGGVQVAPGATISAPGATIIGAGVAGAAAAGTGTQAAATKGGGTIDAMGRPEQPPAPGQQPKAPEAKKAPERDRTFGELSDAGAAKIDKAGKFMDAKQKAIQDWIQNKIDTAKSRGAGDNLRAARDGALSGIGGMIKGIGSKLSRAGTTYYDEEGKKKTGASGKVYKWGESGRTAKENAEGELKQHRSIFGGLVDKGKGFEKKEAKEEYGKLKEKLKKIYPKENYQHLNKEAYDDMIELLAEDKQLLKKISKATAETAHPKHLHETESGTPGLHVATKEGHAPDTH